MADYFDMADTIDEACEGHGCDCCFVALKTGAAIAFGLMGMAEAIRSRPGITACPICQRWSSSFVWNDGELICFKCHDHVQDAYSTGHPYR